MIGKYGMGIFSKFFKTEEEHSINRYEKRIDEIDREGETLTSLSDEDLKKETSLLKKKLDDGISLDDILPRGYALVREAAVRTLNQRHFNVQLIGGMAMHDRGIAEMRTGEGKTLVATLPAYLHALQGKGVHVITVNDYLARRDAVWMGQIYALLGLTIGVINDNASYLYDQGHREKDEERDELGSYKIVYDFLRPVSRKEAYAADITYGTNNQFGFDFLRDNTVYSLDDMNQRGHAYAIIDEVDSVLIDEARNPLIISTPAAEGESFYATFTKIAALLEKEKDYKVDEKSKSVLLNKSGVSKVEKALSIENIYTDENVRVVHYLNNALLAKSLYRKDREYVLHGNKVVIVDEFTGRLQPGRRWGEGIHQAIESKEGVNIERESRTLASVTFQNYFRMYGHLCGMTGTARSSAEELYKVYGLSVYIIPTNKDVRRTDHSDLVFKSKGGKYKYLARDVAKLNKSGQPVLIGTASIEKNEEVSALLKKNKVPHAVLNAKNHENEAEIIAQAGKRGSVTIATNLAGRGVDIRLGGIPFSEKKYDEVKKTGGLYVIGTERHEARRIDDQLRGRSGRQGDPGSTRFYVSFDDPLMRIFGGEKMKSLLSRVSLPDDEPIESKMITNSIERSQKKVEGHYFDARRQTLEYDQVLNRHRTRVYTLRFGILSGGEDVLEDWFKVASPLDEKYQPLWEEKKESLGEEKFYTSARFAILNAIDISWIGHLEQMKHALGSVSLRSYGQKEPIVEYKHEASRLYSIFEQNIVKNAFVNIQRLKKE